MRKITSLVICVLLLVTLAVPAVAETAVPTFKLTADKTELVPGETVTITVSVDEGAPCSNFGVIVKYDKDIFNFVSVDSDSNKGGMQMSILADPSGDINTNIFAGSNGGDPYPGVGAWNTNRDEDGNIPATTPSGVVGRVVLEAYENVSIGETTNITGIASVNVDNTRYSSEVAPVEVVFVEQKGMLGDVNLDEKVTAADIVALRNAILRRTTLNDQQAYNADVNFDGKSTAADIVVIRNFILRRISSFE